MQWVSAARQQSIRWARRSVGWQQRIFSRKSCQRWATGMALNVLAYNMKRVMTIMGAGGLLEAMLA
jgi:hypothetical protein